MGSGHLNVHSGITPGENVHADAALQLRAELLQPALQFGGELGSTLHFGAAVTRREMDAGGRVTWCRLNPMTEGAFQAWYQGEKEVGRPGRA